jgi:hypothetical protein
VEDLICSVVESAKSIVQRERLIAVRLREGTPVSEVTAASDEQMLEK